MSDAKTVSASAATRRDFLKTASAGSALVAGFPAIISAQSVTKAIKVGLVGCGGRGSGAAMQALRADDYAELTAVADVNSEHAQACLDHLSKRVEGKVKVDPSHIFLGLDAYQKVIDSGVDVVLLATPPGFRPVQLKACVDANKHIFAEKPVAVDAPGIRSVLETVKRHKEKNHSLGAGLCWRYSKQVKAAFEQLHNGTIGDLVAYYATYYTSPVKPMPPASERPAGMSDIEWQIKNWYNFQWLCGDSIVEQAVHSVDKIAWSMNDKPPVSCVGVGGRQIPAEGGNIYDHFEVNYLYPNGTRAFLASRQITNCYNENADYMMGSKGTCTIGRGAMPRITGATEWTYTGPKNDMYQTEHDVLFASIRKGQPVHNGERLATSTMLAIMGRMAAYTGREVTWEEALNSQHNTWPGNFDWNSSHEVAPMPRPGITKLT